MFEPTAEVIADSVSPQGDRLTTMCVTGHRFILAEFNTHRVFSRNSASSRAIPYAKMRAKALEQTAYPLSWPAEQRGMQGGSELNEGYVTLAQHQWSEALMSAVNSADRLHGLGLHKSVVNRLLEPFLPHTIIVSATQWQGFWDQRCHPDAQPEIRALAEKMKQAYDASSPVPTTNDGWHAPYVSSLDIPVWCEMRNVDPVRLTDAEVLSDLRNDLLKISVARCARVSYLTHDGKRDLAKDIELYDRLKDHAPPHASPFEHVATPVTGHDEKIEGNFRGWNQLRHVLGLG